MSARLAAPHPMDGPNAVLAGGVSLVALGALLTLVSRVFPFTTTLVIGLIMTVGGALAFLEAQGRARRDARRHSAERLSAAVLVGMGVLLTLWPHPSAGVLAPLLLAFFLLDGALLVLHSLTIRDAVWRAELGTGLVTLALGVVVGLNWRAAGVALAGTLAGLHLAGRGFMFVAASFASRRAIRGG